MSYTVNDTTDESFEGEKLYTKADMFELLHDVYVDFAKDSTTDIDEVYDVHLAMVIKLIIKRIGGE